MTRFCLDSMIVHTFFDTNVFDTPQHHLTSARALPNNANDINTSGYINNGNPRYGRSITLAKTNIQSGVMEFEFHDIGCESTTGERTMEQRTMHCHRRSDNMTKCIPEQEVKKTIFRNRMCAASTFRWPLWCVGPGRHTCTAGYRKKV
jgi:hypothetical protein